MQYMRAYKFPFEHPKWMTNLLLGGVCLTFIPVVGAIVVIGWVYEVIESIHRRGEQSYPDFDFGKFAAYLSRGVWPFLVSAVLGLLFLPFGLAFGVLFGAILAGSGGRPDPGLLTALFVGYFAFAMLFGLVVNFISIPVTLRAGLMLEFKAAFSLSFLWDWLKKMWLETLLVLLFQMVTGLALTVVGLLMCCIGVIPIGMLQMMAQAHLHEQLYSLYLQRGGMAIPLEQEMPSES